MLRKTMMGLGLMGMLSSEVYAEDIEYASMSLGELTKYLQEKTVVLNDFNFKKEITDYDGAAIVLFYSSCNQTENADNIDRNMEIVYLQLRDKFQSAEVNALPLKFTSFDGCKYKGNNGKVIIGLNVRSTETHMYLDGQEVDRRVGGPTNENGVKASINNMGWWINYALLGIRQEEDKDRDIVLLYKGDSKLEEYPHSEIQN